MRSSLHIDMEIFPEFAIKRKKQGTEQCIKFAFLCRKKEKLRIYIHICTHLHLENDTGGIHNIGPTKEFT